MKRSRPCLPRKMKKAMDALLISNDGEVFTKVSYRLRHYPRTKWVVRAERQFRRKWLECKHKDGQLKALRFLNYEKYGFSRDGITRCCRGRQRLCGGLNWFYEKDYMPIYFSGDTSSLVLPPDSIRNPDGTFKAGHHNYKGRKRKMTPEYMQNRRENMLRQHRLGLLPHDNTRNFKAVVEIETGTVYPSIGHAAKATGYTYGGMQFLLRKAHKASKTGCHYCLKSVYDRIPHIV